MQTLCGSCESVVFNQGIESASVVPPQPPCEAPAQFAAVQPRASPVPRVDLSPSPATPPTTADGANRTRERAIRWHTINRPTHGRPVWRVPQVKIAECTPIQAHKDVDHVSQLSLAVAFKYRVLTPFLTALYVLLNPVASCANITETACHKIAAAAHYEDVAQFQIAAYFPIRRQAPGDGVTAWAREPLDRVQHLPW